MIFIFKILLLHHYDFTLRKYGANIQCALKINEVKLHKKSIYKLMIKINCVRLYFIRSSEKGKNFLSLFVEYLGKKIADFSTLYFVSRGMHEATKINVTFFVLNKIIGSISLSRIYSLHIIKYLAPVIHNTSTHSIAENLIKMESFYD